MRTRAPDAFARLCLDGGEDYELLVAGPADLADVAGLVAIGRLEDGPAGAVSIV